MRMLTAVATLTIACSCELVESLHAQVTPHTVIQDTLFIPEGIAHDPQDGSLYIGSTYRRSIMRLDKDLKATTFSAAPELLGVVGMKVDATRRRLWVASAHWHTDMPMVRSGDAAEGSSRLHVFDLQNGKLLKTWRLQGSDTQRYFLNDVDILRDGTALITDTHNQRLYRASLTADTLTRLTQLEGYPNGIALHPDGNTAYVALWGQTIRIAAVDVRTGSARMLADPTQALQHGIDGLYWSERGLIAVQPFRPDAKVARFVLNAEGTAIVRGEVLDGAYGPFEQPTTAAIAGDTLWVIANSHLQTFLRATREQRPGALRPVTLLRIPLR